MSSENRPASRAERRRRTEERILVAARDLFAEVGYERATIRAVAASAGVDPALVMQHFGSKEDLFRRAVHVASDEIPPMEPEKLAELLLDVLNLKLAEKSPASLAMLRSMLTHPEATERARASMNHQLKQFSEVITAEDAELRAALIVAATLGLGIARDLLGLDGLRDAPPERITGLLRPYLHVLTHGLPEPPPADGP